MFEASAHMPVGRSIGRAHKFIRAWGDRELAGLGSSVTEWIVLFHIANAPAPGASQTEIARYSDMGGPALVRHLDRLEADDIVVRTRDADDRRVIRLTLTRAGHERLEALGQVMARCDQQVRSVLTEDEAAVMQTALDKVFQYCFHEVQGELPPGLALGPPPGGFGPTLTPPADTAAPSPSERSS